MERVKHRDREEKSVDGDIPTAPTIEDFYYDPGIRERLAQSSSFDTDVSVEAVVAEKEISDGLDRIEITGTS